MLILDTTISPFLIFFPFSIAISKINPNPDNMNPDNMNPDNMNPDNMNPDNMNPDNMFS